MAVTRWNCARYGVFAIGAVVSLIAASGATAAAAASVPNAPTAAAISIPGVTGSSNGWLTYTRTLGATLALKSARTVTVTGRRDPGGACVVSGSTAAPIAAGSPARYQEEVAFNPRTCQERLLSGTLSAAGLARLDALSADQRGAPTTITGRAASLGSSAEVTPNATSYGHAYTKTAWIDPLDITITSLANNLSWPLYGAGGTLNETAYPYEFKYDGWSSSGVQFPGGFRYTSSDGGGWYISATDHFTNTDFASFVYAVFGVAGWLACGAPLTATAHFNHDVTTYGYRNGARNRAWNDTATGACTDLVHHGEWDGFGTKH